MFQLTAGYTFEFTGDVSPEVAPNDDWEIVIYQPTGQETLYCERMIDGVQCAVFKTPTGYVAQTMQACHRPPVDDTDSEGECQEPKSRYYSDECDYRYHF